MRIALFVVIAILAFYIGYKVSEYKDLKQQVKANIQPIVNELRVELTALKEKLSEELSSDDIKAVQDRKAKIIDLLSKFYGITKEEANKLFNKI